MAARMLPCLVSPAGILVTCDGAFVQSGPLGLACLRERILDSNAGDEDDESNLGRYAGKVCCEEGMERAGVAEPPDIRFVEVSDFAEY
jgi:hypothetical protein